MSPDFMAVFVWLPGARVPSKFYFISFIEYVATHVFYDPDNGRLCSEFHT